MKPTLPTASVRSSLSRREALRLFGLGGAGALLGSSTLGAGIAAAPRTAPPDLTLPTTVPPSLAGPQPAHYRFKIGGVEALAVCDGGFAMPPPDSPFGVGEPREKIAAVLDAAMLPTDLVRLVFNVLLVRLGPELVMIDTGCGPVFGAAGGQLVANLAAAGVRPEQITAILITHMHGDHFGGLLDADKRPVFPNAKLFIHRVEHAFWSGGECEALGADTVAGVRSYLDAFKGRWQLIAGGERLIEGLEIVDAFGHTPGHFAIAITAGGEQLFHFVDIVHHHAISFAHPEWRIQFDVQHDAAIATRQRLLDRLAADKARVFGAHMPFPSLGRVRRAGKAYEYVIEPWVMG